MAYFTNSSKANSKARPQGKEGLAANIRIQALSEPNARGKTPTLNVIRRGIKLAKPSNAVVNALEKAVDLVNRYDGYDAVKVVMVGLEEEDAGKALKGLKELIALTKVKDTGLISEMLVDYEALEAEDKPKEEVKPEAPKGAEDKPAKPDGWSPARRAAHEAAKAAKAAKEEAPKGAEDVKTEIEALTAPKEPTAKELVLMALKGQQDALKAQSEANTALHSALMAYMGD